MLNLVTGVFVEGRLQHLSYSVLKGTDCLKLDSAKIPRSVRVSRAMGLIHSVYEDFSKQGLPLYHL